MNLIGILLTTLASFGYSFRYSFVKDLSSHKVSRESVNLFYRITSLPFILLVAFIFKTDLLNVSTYFPLWFLGTLLANVSFGLYQVYLYQKHNFSSIEGLAFLEILFTTIAGTIIFREILTERQLVGVGIIILAFILLAFYEIRSKKINLNYLEIIFYYLFSTSINIFNKKSILYSSPLAYSVYLTLGLITLNYLLTLFKRESVYNWKNKPTNKLLILVGIMTAVSFISINIGYMLLPVGVVSTILSMSIFFSLWLSKKKYSEINILPKVIAASISFVGILILFT